MSVECGMTDNGNLEGWGVAEKWTIKHYLRGTMYIIQVMAALKAQASPLRSMSMQQNCTCAPEYKFFKRQEKRKRMYLS